ncbi:hypothetical protein MOX02_45010 [Methylobacterium oxalidis]|uniref:Uncharacterized protein n=1 Tax=Methylobacterium oxalidis TaxID=944322 RepID=A0A512J953_9HYPH|nr:hypothetical protein MOX02_45010 [Methylobacterium oxalidis]GJE33513.1 hypothetical protein LDDCCGHA_3713 [Methylobacterium oxalidis]GLS65503.1 hypothetical protein GCM10007888_38850 [Methylobacterium oxalidis]
MLERPDGSPTPEQWAAADLTARAVAPWFFAFRAWQTIWVVPCFEAALSMGKVWGLQAPAEPSSRD